MAQHIPRPTTPALLVASVFLVATCLRPALTSVGPVLSRMGSDLGLGESAQGMIGALPLLGFALVSPAVHRWSRRLGVELTLLISLGVLVVGIATRSLAGAPGLWVGTAVIGCAIAVGNVLIPAIAKRDYARNVSVATAVYSAFLSLAAAGASAAAVPLADGPGGWRWAIGVWALPVVVVAAIWAVRTRYAPRPGEAGLTAVPDAVSHLDAPASAPSSPSVWRSRTAWGVTILMGVQSTFFYIMVTWLPTIEQAHGVSEHAAGIHLFLYQLVGVASGLAIPLLMRHPSQATAAVTASTPMVVAMLGLWLAPAASAWWIALAGAGSGAALVVALGLVALRSHSPGHTVQLSGMAQCVGYLMAAAGPVVAGWLTQVTGGWAATLLLCAGLASVQLALGITVGRAPRTLAAAVPG